MKEIDGRGLACPAPVLQTREALQDGSPNEVRVVVDNPSAQQNVLRFLESQGFQVVLERVGNDYGVIGRRGAGSSVTPVSVAEPLATDGKIMVMCTTDRIGSGDDVLGSKLMVSFMHTLKEMGAALWRIVLVNNGVKLTVDGSEVLEELKRYEAAGCKILVCGTCLNHFDILDQKRVGETTNMLDIVCTMQLADKVITL
ncbi:sulfurtransferase-like selenium metabolism protein YedF [Desulforhopalus singaporensis]|uniref:Selenium metabolism protein YedF n=1 Tax=Desulforhopalus singaporensis TaxID=91360 RepID=A0A1H0SJL0_9BACT|nr:sulfurtransferase-like selenium metabolism protein YedF [Desulforhopalus singaporensis]SDP41719.1 selenium metabolism protein YedF [Desulforhopalus singaporensis]